MASPRTDTASCYQIGDLLLDTGTRRVSRGDETLNVSGLTFDLLLALAESAPNLVSHDDLAESVWAGRPVTPETITQRVKILRDALSDDASAPRYVELIRGQGYRLIVGAERLETRPPTGTWPNRRWGIALAVAGLAALAVAGFSLLVDERPPSLAVLPFVDMSAEGDQEHLADGIAEELISTLAELDDLHVASRTSSFALKGSEENLETIGEQLGVGAILEGSVRKFGDDIRVSVQLVDLDTGSHLWSQTFDQELDDIFVIQEQIALATAGALGVTLGVGDPNAFRGAGTDNFAAYEAYLRKDYERAIELDAEYAAAWARQGIRIASTMWSNMPEDAPEIVERAHGYIARALELDPESSAAHGRFGSLIYTNKAWQQAEQSFRKSLELRRSRHNLMAYGHMLLRVGRVRKALETYREGDAAERTPHNPNRLRNSANIAAGDFEAARAMAVRFTDNRRFDSELHIALNDGTRDDVRRALSAMPESMAATAIFRPVRDELDSPERALAALETVLASEELSWPSKYHDIAVLAAYLGDPNLALESFSREMPYTSIRFAILWYPVMAEARRLPRFKTLVEQARLVEYWRQYRWADNCRPAGPDDFECY